MLCLTACNDDDDDNGGNGGPGDTTAPMIEFAEGRDSFRPAMGETRSSNDTHIHIRFKAVDNSGLEEVRVSVSGTYIGTVPDNFDLIDITDVYSADSEDEAFAFEAGATELNVDSDDTDLYWFGPSSRPEITNAIIAGPYDFSVWAKDVFGNETSTDQMVNNRFYITRAYAPQVEVTNLHDGELEGEENEPLVVEGTITSGDGNLAGDVAFIWVRLVEEDMHDDFAAATPLSEVIWGTSKRIQASGQAIPAGEIDLSAALAGDNSIVLPDGHGHYDLIVWVEDEHGNVTRAVVEVHAD